VEEVLNEPVSACDGGSPVSDHGARIELDSVILEITTLFYLHKVAIITLYGNHFQV